MTKGSRILTTDSVDPLVAMRETRAPGFCSVASVNEILSEHHYLGPIGRGFAWMDRIGVLVFANPSSRRLPATWLELVRWCILDRSKNAGSAQWSRVRRALASARPDITTIVSYSDPSAGHTGALYRASNWIYAPTWHRLRPPPSGNGAWSARKSESVKDRWIFPMLMDPQRERLLVMKDESILRRHPEMRYSEPAGVSYRKAVEIMANRQEDPSE